MKKIVIPAALAASQLGLAADGSEIKSLPADESLRGSSIDSGDITVLSAVEELLRDLIGSQSITKVEDDCENCLSQSFIVTE